MTRWLRTLTIGQDGRSGTIYGEIVRSQTEGRTRDIDDLSTNIESSVAPPPPWGFTLFMLRAGETPKGLLPTKRSFRLKSAGSRPRPRRKRQFSARSAIRSPLSHELSDISELGWRRLTPFIERSP